MDTKTPKSVQEYQFPVWGTQGGGIVREAGLGRYIFVEAPKDFPNLHEGDTMPEEWGISAGNNLAKDVMDGEDYWEE